MVFIAAFSFGGSFHFPRFCFVCLMFKLSYQGSQVTLQGILKLKSRGKSLFCTTHSFRLLKLCVQRVKNFLFILFYKAHEIYPVLDTRTTQGTWSKSHLLHLAICKFRSCWNIWKQTLLWARIWFTAAEVLSCRWASQIFVYRKNVGLTPELGFYWNTVVEKELHQCSLLY